MGFRLVQKLVTLKNDLERRNGHFCVIFTEFGNFKGVLLVVDEAITMDNLRLLCLVVNVCRETTQCPRYKFLADS